MKTTRAYVINLRKMSGYIALILIFICLILFLTKGDSKEIAVKWVKDYSLSRELLSDNIPLLSGKKAEKYGITPLKILSFILNEDLEEPLKIINERVAFIKSVRHSLKERYSFADESNNYYIPKLINKMLKEELQNYNPATEKIFPSIRKNGNYIERMGLTIDNKTTYSINTEKLYKENLMLNIKNKKPTVLIVHTHGSESYNPTDRNQDISKNVVAVGAEMERIFKENGIEVIRSEKMHDVPKFNNSYKNSLATVDKILAQNPSVSAVLDIHRDAMITERGEIYKVVAEYKGEKISQVMFVVGTNQGGLKHDGWRENLKFALRCQKRLNEIAPNVARPVNLRQERFNQHTTSASVIVEIGTNGNTLSESLASGRITAQAISDVLNDNTK